MLTNRDNLLESVRGYYYADTKELIAVERVEMRNDEYELTGDSVVYNMATDNAFFYDRTNIWNRDGDYLYADRGAYEKADTLYIVTRNGYLLTDKQEMWSDSIDFTACATTSSCAVTSSSTIRSTRCWPSASTASIGRSRAMRCSPTVPRP